MEADSLPLYGRVVWVAFPTAIRIVSSSARWHQMKQVGLDWEPYLSASVYVDIVRFIFIS